MSIVASMDSEFDRPLRGMPIEYASAAFGRGPIDRMPVARGKAFGMGSEYTQVRDAFTTAFLTSLTAGGSAAAQTAINTETGQALQTTGVMSWLEPKIQWTIANPAKAALYAVLGIGVVAVSSVVIFQGVKTFLRR